jgi:hypothetical protein
MLHKPDESDLQRLRRPSQKTLHALKRIFLNQKKLINSSEGLYLESGKTLRILGRFGKFEIDPSKPSTNRIYSKLRRYVEGSPENPNPYPNTYQI